MGPGQTSPLALFCNRKNADESAEMQFTGKGWSLYNTLQLYHFLGKAPTALLLRARRGDLDHWESVLSCSLILATTRDEIQAGTLHGAWAGKDRWSPGNVVSHQPGGGGGLRVPSGSVFSVILVSGGGLVCFVLFHLLLGQPTLT